MFILSRASLQFPSVKPLPFTAVLTHCDRMLPVASYPVLQTQTSSRLFREFSQQQKRGHPVPPSFPHTQTQSPYGEVFVLPFKSHFSTSSPDEVTAEDEAQDEDEDACAKDDHVDVERQVLEGDGRHGARLVGVNQSQTTEAPYTKTKGGLKNTFTGQEAPENTARHADVW